MHMHICVCAYVLCIYVCMYVCMYTCKHTRMLINEMRIVLQPQTLSHRTPKTTSKGDRQGCPKP